MIRIWFNHWFSAAYNIINMLRQADRSFYIICTNENERNVISAICDESYPEPPSRGDEYVDFCLGFCREYGVDVFIPRREMLSVSRRKADFERIGVKVMVDDYELVETLNRKDMAYKALAAKGVSTIPDHYIVTNAEEFLAAYESLLKNYKEVCFKFVRDEGGKSFRLIDNNRKSYSALFKKQNTRMTLDSVMEALREKESFPPMIVMPNLPGEEVSVDCLNTVRGLIMLPRVKDCSRIERLCFDGEIIEKTREVYDAVRLEQPCNIQFKYLDGKPYFLEVNTRMSGGVQMSCAAAGVNIPYIAVCKLLGKNIEWSIRREERYITHVETPIVL